MKNTIILLSGYQATGKTTLGKKISEEFQIPFISVDEMKELIWDNIGWEKEFDEMQAIGVASFDLMYYILKSQVRVQGSCVIDAFFNPEFANDRLKGIKKEHSTHFLQINCRAEKRILEERLSQRNFKDRHLGHIHNDALRGKEELMKNLGTDHESKVLRIGCPTYTLDTTDFEKVEYEDLFEWIKENSP